MPRGRPRKRTPEENKRLGNPGKRKVKGIEADHPDASDLVQGDAKPQRKPSKPLVKPQWLTGTAAKVWKEMTDALRDLDVLHRIDTYLLVEYCTWTGIALDKQKEIAQAPTLSRMTAGDQEHPIAAIKLAKEAWEQSRKAYKALGLGPIERKKANITLNDANKTVPNTSGLEGGNPATDNGSTRTKSGVLLTPTQQWVLGLRKDRPRDGA